MKVLLSRNFSGEYADRVRIGWMNHLAHTQQLSQLHPTYTAAFRGDLLKKGADLKNLKKGLEGFRKMAKAFGEVEKRWKHVANKTDPEFHFKLRGPNTILMYIEFFFTDHGRPKVGVANCSNTPGDPDLIKKYKAQGSGPREVVISLSTLSRFVRDLPRLLVNDTVGCLNVTHQAVKGYSIQTDADVDEIVEKMGDEFLKCSGMELDAFLELFSMLKEKQERVIKALDVSGIVVGRIPVGEVVQKIGAEETIQCLRAQNFSVNILQRMVEIFLAFYKYYRPEKFVLMIEYLENVEAVKKAVLNVEKVIRDHRSMPNNPVLRLNNSKFYAENLAISTSALTKLIEVRNNRKKLLEVGTHFTEFIHQKMTAQGIIGDFHSPQFHVAGLVKQADEIEKRAKELVGSDVETMTRIFVDVANVKGVVGQRELLRTLIAYHSNDPNFDKNVLAEWQTLVDNDLDFSYYSTPLKRGPSAVVAIEDYFDRIFGRKADGNTKTVVVREGSWLSVILISIGFILLVFILILVIYGFTKNGREKYEDWYIFYFGKPHHFEKRWRYSAFTDVEDGKNALHDALREINDVNLKKQLRKGAYIKAYNKFGNTALHVATKAGHPELVEMLIRHGADRRLLNVKNRTPEQCIPSEIAPEDVENYRRIEEIYRKYQKKQFRIRVPPRFPPSSFHIFVDETVDVNLTNQFMEKFKSTVNLELIPTTTHFVVKTDPNGILETENFSLLSFLFSGAIMVKDTWIAACIADEQAMSQDSKYLVEKIKYRGIVYDTVTQWSAAAAKSEIPYLFGVQVALVMKECNRFDFYENLVAKHGGVLASTFPLKQNYRVGSHPYLHAHLGPLFLIHDGKIDLTGYETEKMYTLFTEEEFIRFMLRTEIVRDTSKNPITVPLHEN
uniref:BRCT domain-containing protein n=2 Tax=Caenorhabditis tropicalis TaxID=1561998 RepID=A0A1I7UKN3_9PELO